MKTEKIIALFLTLVLSIQMLPLQKIAAWLGSGQVTEEIAHAGKPAKPYAGLDEIKHPGLTLHDDYIFRGRFTLAVARYLQDEALFNRYQDDILTPPPNQA